MATRTLTREQQSVVEMLRDGYVIVCPCDTGEKPKYYLRKSGHSYKERLSKQTLKALLARGIVAEHRQPGKHTEWLIYEIVR